MISLGVFNGGRGGDDEQEISLGTPDEAEAKDLARHVGRCAMRFRFFTGKLGRQSKDIRQVKLLMYLLVAFILATSNPAQQLFRFLGGLH